ncbi:MAG: phosphodiesterase [Bacteroidales bacterium]
MKYILISDIHGCEPTLRQALSKADEMQADRILILGDILYHGPRNSIPEGYNPQEVVAMLNLLKDRIIAVRGNCDAEVDQMLLNFPCMSDYALIQENRTTFFATHGHIYNPQQLPSLSAGNVFMYGHTHLWQLEYQNGIILCNPGSITFPKENRPATFGFYEEGVLSIHRLDDGTILKDMQLA